jgi:hypothetical protein
MEDRNGPLSGLIEANETDLGGKKREKEQTSKRDPDDDQPTGRSDTRKSRMTLATERGGRARAAMGKTHFKRTIATFVLANLDIGRAVLVSDECPAHRWIGSTFPAHLHVNHAKGEYIRRDPLTAADVHTNRHRSAIGLSDDGDAEAFSARLKRAVIGVWPWFSIKHTDRHLHEVAVRWNRRAMTTNARLAGLFAGTADWLRWKELVA